MAISTVSKVLNHYPNVSEETKQKVTAAIEELGFLPNTIVFGAVFQENRKNCASA